MSKPDPLTITVDMAIHSLTSGQLDNLASEFYGHLVEMAGEGQSKYLQIEFSTVRHPYLTDKPDNWIYADECAEAMQKALLAFKTAE